MAVITMLLTAPWLKLEQAGRRTAQRGRVSHPRDLSSHSVFSTSTKLYINVPGVLISPHDIKDFQVSAPTQVVNPSRAAVVVVGEAAGSAGVKQAADSSHGNGPVFPADTGDCNGTLG